MITIFFPANFYLYLPMNSVLIKMIFCSLSSGSSGNCYYLGSETHGILIDAGISATSIRKFLKEMGISIHAIMGILVTHKHSDHVRGLEVLTRKYNIPIYTTQKIRKSIISPKSNLSRDNLREIDLQKEFHLAGLNIVAFPVHHDAPETIGFHVSYGNKKITIVTDLGHICETAAEYIKAANLLVIESNYDEQMLVNGQYPYFLKARVKSDHGHLGNHQTAAFLAENISDNLTHICLAHLSKNNNTPEIALQSLRQAFFERGIVAENQLHISVLKRNIPSDVIRL
jgi:phosphoribosyl 1,2-cyclic phosphodiesterase